MQKFQVFGLVGIAALAIGVFSPIVSFSELGNFNYFANGTGYGVVVLALAGISLILLLLKQPVWLWGTGALSLAIIVFHFSAVLSRVQSYNEPGVQIQWGWALLGLGAICLMISAAVRRTLESNNVAVIPGTLPESQTVGEDPVTAARRQVLEHKLTKDPSDIATLVEHGAFLIERKDFVAAATAFEKVLVYEPKNLNALQNLNRIYLELGKVKDLERIVSGLREAGHATPAAYLSLAQLQTVDDTFRTLAMGLAEFPNSLELHQLRFERASSRGITDIALSSGDAIVRLSPHNREMLLLLSEIALSSDKEARALSYFEQIVRLEPNDSWARLHLGLARIGSSECSWEELGTMTREIETIPIDSLSGTSRNHAETFKAVMKVAGGMASKDEKRRLRREEGSPEPILMPFTSSIERVFRSRILNQSSPSKLETIMSDVELVAWLVRFPEYQQLVAYCEYRSGILYQDSKSWSHAHTCFSKALNRVEDGDIAQCPDIRERLTLVNRRRHQKTRLMVVIVALVAGATFVCWQYSRGSLVVSTQPSALVRITNGDDSTTCIETSSGTYASPKMWLGDYQVSICKQGFKLYSGPVTIEGGEHNSLEIQLDTAFYFVNLNSTPSHAEVKLNGRVIGLTPYSLRTQSIENSIVLSKDCATPLFLKLPSRTSDTSIVLNSKFSYPEKGNAFLITQPGAELSIMSGVNPIRFIDMGSGKYFLSGVSFGEHLVSIRKDGFKDYQETVTIVGGEQCSLRIPLDTAYYFLRVNSIPSDAEIWLHGTLVGHTPLNLKTQATDGRLILTKNCDRVSVTLPARHSDTSLVLSSSLQRGYSGLNGTWTAYIDLPTSGAWLEGSLHVPDAYLDSSHRGVIYNIIDHTGGSQFSRVAIKTSIIQSETDSLELLLDIADFPEAWRSDERSRFLVTAAVDSCLLDISGTWTFWRKLEVQSGHFRAHRKDVTDSDSSAFIIPSNALLEEVPSVLDEAPSQKKSQMKQLWKVESLKVGDNVISTGQSRRSIELAIKSEPTSEQLSDKGTRITCVYLAEDLNIQIIYKFGAKVGDWIAYEISYRW